VSMDVYPKVSDDPAIQARYELMRDGGQSHGMAEVLAFRKFPGVAGTDSQFLRGRAKGADSIAGSEEPVVRKEYFERAERAGVSPAGKVYLGQLARFPGDPQAWVSGTGDVKRRLEERGWGCESPHLKVKPPQYADAPDPRSKPYAVAPDIVKRHVDEAVATNPDLKARDRKELEHETGRKLAGVRGSKS
jgi:hypothetical protein